MSISNSEHHCDSQSITNRWNNWGIRRISVYYMRARSLARRGVLFSISQTARRLRSPLASLCQLLGKPLWGQSGLSSNEALGDEISNARRNLHQVASRSLHLSEAAVKSPLFTAGNAPPPRPNKKPLQGLKSPVDIHWVSTVTLPGVVMSPLHLTTLWPRFRGVRVNLCELVLTGD